MMMNTSKFIKNDNKNNPQKLMITEIFSVHISHKPSIHTAHNNEEKCNLIFV